MLSFLFSKYSCAECFGKCWKHQEFSCMKGSAFVPHHVSISCQCQASTTGHDRGGITDAVPDADCSQFVWITLKKFNMRIRPDPFSDVNISL